jgi:hypothetical protein
VEYRGSEPAQTYRFEVADGEIRLPSGRVHVDAALSSDHEVRRVVEEGLRALDTGGVGSVEGTWR